MSDAIVRTLFRLFVTPPAAARVGDRRAGEVSLRLDVGGFYRRMAGGVAARAASRRSCVVCSRRCCG